MENLEYVMLANFALPALSGYYTSLLFFPVAVIGILVVEALALWLTLGRQRWWWCVLAVFATNVASTMFGLVFTVLVPIGPTFHEIQFWWEVLAYLLALVISLAIETPLNCLFFPREMRGQVVRGTIYGNLISYCALGAILALLTF